VVTWVTNREATPNDVPPFDSDFEHFYFAAFRFLLSLTGCQRGHT